MTKASVPPWVWTITPSAHERNGAVVGAVLVESSDEIMLISTGGVLIRTKVVDIRDMGRSTQGVTLINLDDGTRLAGLEKVIESDSEADAEADAEAGDEGGE